MAVYLFQRSLIAFLNEKFDNLNKIFYFSDGSGAQYKNKKNFANLYYHKRDFNVMAECHFFATSHGKGPCDDLRGVIKRLAAKASLQNVNDLINTPEKFFLWVNKNIVNIILIQNFFLLKNTKLKYLNWKIVFEKRKNDSWYFKTSFIHSKKTRKNRNKNNIISF
ncbi:hypothetical protein ALC60_01131 [Trachymyrmex zeteki]|uniref:Uncharacterized protein n=1 Tax=Mycetomoellerius zeteki TaxID=64791 RepID=A0A151XH73_9HYME|nr:hypothetical protein ALC60_01131 [Trachymyrmex zeteki]